MSQEDPIVAMAAERIAKGSKSFAGAARLFDPTTRASAFMLYAWCRHCDDEIDGQVLGHGASGVRRPSQEVLERLRAQTLDALSGGASEPVFIGLQRVVQAHAIADVHPLELIRGMEMDVEMETAGRRYRTLEDLLAYCYHVAGCVGVMMACVMGARDHAALLRASDLGIAFQLTNIARDVVADAAQGRVYLPSDLLAAHGLSETDVSERSQRPQVYAAVDALLNEADRYYASAEAGIAALPFRSAWAVAAARRVYGDIGGLVRAKGASAWDERLSTSKARKLAGVIGALGDAVRSRRHAPPSSRTGLWTPPSLT